MLLSGVLEDNGVDPAAVLSSAGVGAGASEDSDREDEEEEEDDDDDEDGDEEEAAASVASTAEDGPQSPGKDRDGAQSQLNMRQCIHPKCIN